MSVGRLVAVGFILVAATAAWMVLAGSTDFRTRSADRQIHGAVSGLWGRAQQQLAPRFSDRAASPRRGQETRWLQPEGSDVAVKFDLDQRRKGLLWYATYLVDFDATYRLRNAETTRAADIQVRFPFPDETGVYDGFAVTLDGKPLPVDYQSGEAQASFPMPAGSSAALRITYRTQGLDEWRYVPSDSVGVVKDFSLVMLTDFEDIDFPGNSVSPGKKERTEDGWKLTWDYASLVSGRPLALTMPKPLNPGPVASRISYFAPVSLLFYFAALLLLTTTSGLKVHPMNYAFLAAGFFAFHLLFTYLADQVPLWVAFGVASVASLVLCVGYLALVAGRGRALVELAVGQFVFLVLFSFSFFFDGFTGLAITIGSVLTLAFFMVKTGKTDWDAVFVRTRPTAPLPPVAPSPRRA